MSQTATGRGTWRGSTASGILQDQLENCRTKWNCAGPAIPCRAIWATPISPLTARTAQVVSALDFAYPPQPPPPLSYGFRAICTKPFLQAVTLTRTILMGSPERPVQPRCCSGRAGGDARSLPLARGANVPIGLGRGLGSGLGSGLAARQRGGWKEKTCQGLLFLSPRVVPRVRQTATSQPF